jgi:pectate lyase
VERARRVADRMVEQRYHHGFFLPSEDRVYAQFDAVEPLAIAALDATLRGEPEQVPAYLNGSGNLHGHYNGHGRSYDSDVIWSVTRDEV